MAIDQQPAYILHARPYRETSLLLECLTPDVGRLGMVVRGARRRGARLAQAELQPFQPLDLGYVLRGELATLRTLDPRGRPWPLTGEVLLAGLYVNELVVRLSVRQDPYDGLYGIYELALARLAEGPDMAWTLRRFERDLLAALGYALVLEQDVDGAPLADTALYHYVPEQGAIRADNTPGVALPGCDLRALGADTRPDAAAMRRLRLLLRGLLRHYLGGRDLQSWHLAGAVARVGQEAHGPSSPDPASSPSARPADKDCGTP